MNQLEHNLGQIVYKYFYFLIFFSMYKLFMYCNKICFRSLCCPLSVQNYHKLKRIHANIVQNPTFLGRFQTFGGQCNWYTVYFNSDAIYFANCL